MKRLLTLSSFLIFISCGQHPRTAEHETENKEDQTDSVEASVNRTKLTSIQEANKDSTEVQLQLKKPTVVIVTMDSLETEVLKKADGEDNFYTAADDLMWYHSQLLKKMDSVGVAVKYTDQDRIKIITPSKSFEITKDTTFTLYTYFYYDGEDFKRTELFELLDDY